MRESTDCRARDAPDGSALVDQLHVRQGPTDDALAAGLETVDGLAVDTPETNIVVETVTVTAVTVDDVRDRLAARGIHVSTFPGGRIRCCTHRDVDASDGDHAVVAAEDAATDWD